MIDYLLSSLSSFRLLLGGSTLLFSIAIGVAATLLATSIMYLVSTASDPVRRRVLQGTGGSMTRSSRATRIDRALGPIRDYIIPSKAEELSKVRKRLMHAGYRQREAVTVFYAVKLVLIIGLAALGAMIAYALPESTSTSIILASSIGGAAGVILPSYVLDKKTEKRRTEIVNAFPDVLDMIVACSEAGLGLNDSIQRVARETTLMFPTLSAELELVNSQIRAGVDRVEALHGLAERTGVDDIEGFVSIISQSVRFGTSIAETLRIFAEEFRDKRMQKAEEQAAKVSTKLIFPLVLCIFPSFFVVAIGPAVITIVRAFESMR